MRTSAEPRYRAIADDLERELRADGLTPGARVPSTRAIVARWDVAMATATKVLAELRRRGLVRSRPGVGTVVAGPTGLPLRGEQSPAPLLTRERIVAAGLTIADREGLEAVSMRRVAGDLRAAPMALYRHVEDKDDLVLRMVDAAYAEAVLPDPPPDGWRAQTAVAARAFWRACHVHTWLGPATSMTRPQAVPGVLPLADFALGALSGLGLSHARTMTAYLALLNYVRGMAMNLDAEAREQAATGLDSEAWMEGQEARLRQVLAGGEYPAFRRYTSRPYDFDLDHIFEFGLARLLDGLEVLQAGSSGEAG